MNTYPKAMKVKYGHLFYILNLILFLCFVFQGIYHGEEKKHTPKYPGVYFEYTGNNIFWNTSCIFYMNRKYFIFKST